MNQSGFSLVLFIAAISILTLGIIGGSLYIKNSHPELLGNPSTSRSPINMELESQNNDVTQDKTNPSYDSVIKFDLQLLAKSLACQYKLNNNKYPENLQAYNQQCGPRNIPSNYATNAPYRYSVTNDGNGFSLRAKLSTGEIYTITETFPIDTSSSYSPSN